MYIIIFEDVEGVIYNNIIKESWMLWEYSENQTTRSWSSKDANVSDKPLQLSENNNQTFKLSILIFIKIFCIFLLMNDFFVTFMPEMVAQGVILIRGNHNHYNERC